MIVQHRGFNSDTHALILVGCYWNENTKGHILWEYTHELEMLTTTPFERDKQK
jgi:hypothetical protein